MVTLQTLDEIAREAEQNGLGEARRLRRQFVQFQQYGLLGSPVEKEHRRGGSGLWHPIQGDLFQCYLRNIRDGVSRGACANVPIGLWLLGEEGIRTTQAQRALSFIAGRFVPVEAPGTSERPWWAKNHGRSTKVRGDRSDIGRDTRRLVKRLSLSTTRPGATRGLLKAVRLMTDGIPEVLVGREAFVEAVQQGNSRVSAVAGSIAYFMISDRLLALSCLPVLTAATPKVLEFWERTQTIFQEATNQSRSQEFRRRLPADEAALFPVASDEVFLGRAAGELLSYFGLAIRGLRGDKMVQLERLGLDPSFSRLFPR